MPYSPLRLGEEAIKAVRAVNAQAFEDFRVFLSLLFPAPAVWIVTPACLSRCGGIAPHCSLFSLPNLLARRDISHEDILTALKGVRSYPVALFNPHAIIRFELSNGDTRSCRTAKETQLQKYNRFTKGGSLRSMDLHDCG
jgi:hypothetical protein